MSFFLCSGESALLYYIDITHAEYREPARPLAHAQAQVTTLIYFLTPGFSELPISLIH